MSQSARGGNAHIYTTALNSALHTLAPQTAAIVPYQRLLQAMIVIWENTCFSERFQWRESDSLILHFCKQRGLWKHWGLFGIQRARVQSPLVFAYIMSHCYPASSAYSTSDDYFLLLSSFWGLINLVSGMKSIVSIPQRARESGKHSDFVGTFWQLLYYLGWVQTLSCGLWKLLQSPNCTSDVECCFHTAFAQHKLAQYHQKKPFTESLPPHVKPKLAI